MFRIGAFSKLTRVSVRMLRYYDDAGLLTPAVIDKFTGYRMYTTDQIPVLQKICLLRDMGFNVTEIGAVMECWESSSVTEYLEDKKRQLLDSIRLEQQRIRSIFIIRSRLLLFLIRFCTSSQPVATSNDTPFSTCFLRFSLLHIFWKRASWAESSFRQLSN